MYDSAARSTLKSSVLFSFIFLQFIFFDEKRTKENDQTSHLLVNMFFPPNLAPSNHKLIINIQIPLTRIDARSARIDFNSRSTRFC